MTTEIDNCDLTEQNTIPKTELIEIQIDALSHELSTLDKDSNTTSLKVENLKSSVGKLKDDIQIVMGRIEQNVEIFRTMLSEKLKVVLDMLSDKQLHLEMTLEECYKVMGDLVEIFLRIGYELENDITSLSTNVDNLDKEMKSITETIPFALVELDSDCNKPFWFINNENKLTLRKNIAVGSILPKFKCGSTFERQQFLNFMIQVFKYYKVPENVWVGLTAKQLIESAQDWWSKNNDKNSITWIQFTELFMKAPFESDEEINFDYNRSRQVFDKYNEQMEVMKCKEVAKPSSQNVEKDNYKNKAEEIYTTNLLNVNINLDNEREKNSIYKNISSLIDNKLVYDNEDAAQNECNTTKKK